MGYTTPGQGTTNVNIFEKASKTAKGIGAQAIAIAKASKEEKERKRMLSNEINQSLTELDDAVFQMPDVKDKSLNATIKAKLEGELKRVHDLSKSGIEGDNSEYLEARSKFKALITKLPNYIAYLNKQKDMFVDNPSGVLNSESNDPRIISMLKDFGAGGADIGVEFIGEDVVWTTSDGLVINASANAKAVEEGSDGLLSYRVDHSKELEGIFTTAVGTNYEGFKITKQIKTDDKTITINKEDWGEQSKIAREQLSNGKALDSYLDQSNYEKYVGDGMLYVKGDSDADNEARRVELKSKIVDDLMQKYGHEKIDPTTGEKIYEHDISKSTSVDRTTETEKTMQIEADYIRNLEYKDKEDFKEIAEYLTRNNKDPNIKYRAGKHDVNGVESGGVIIQQFVEGKWVERPTLINQRNTSKDNNMQLKKLLKITTDEGKQTAVLDDD